MKDRQPNAVITPQEVVGTAPTIINSMEQLKDFLQEKAPLFFNRLGVITQGQRIGRQSIITEPNGLINKTTSQSSDSIFTGSGLCALASYALYDGLKNRVRGIDLDVVQIDTNLEGENWDHPAFELEEFLHQILKAEDEKSETTLFFDSTYRQINHRSKLTLICSNTEELEHYYKRDWDPSYRPSTLRDKERMLKYFEERWGVTEEKYKKLLRSLN